RRSRRTGGASCASSTTPIPPGGPTTSTSSGSTRTTRTATWSRPPSPRCRGTQWKYTEYASGETELYDVLADPFELNNLTTDPTHAALKAELAARLRQLRPHWPPP